MSSHNLRFGLKIKKIGIPLQTPVLLYIKVGYKLIRAIIITQTCYPNKPTVSGGHLMLLLGSIYAKLKKGNNVPYNLGLYNLGPKIDIAHINA